MSIEAILKRDYVNAIEAAEMINVNDSRIRQLCIEGKLNGAFKIGDTWLIPRESVTNYKPGKRGPKPKPPIKETVTNVLNEFETWKGNHPHE